MKALVLPAQFSTGMWLKHKVLLLKLTIHWLRVQSQDCIDIATFNLKMFLTLETNPQALHILRPLNYFLFPLCISCTWNLVTSYTWLAISSWQVGQGQNPKYWKRHRGDNPAEWWEGLRIGHLLWFECEKLPFPSPTGSSIWIPDPQLLEEVHGAFWTYDIAATWRMGLEEPIFSPKQ